jgi:FAD/FMN-containing dehydrogenase
LGGGLGWLSGLFGACCDNLLSARLVTAGGDKLDVDAEHHADLFWAMRGAGANFGVTTSFEARLYPVDKVIGGDIHFAKSDARPVLRGFRDFMRATPDGFQATLNLTNADRGLFISLCYVGDDVAADALLKQIRSWAKPTRENVERQSYAMFAQRAPATKPSNVFAPTLRGIQTVYRESITDEIIEILVEQLEDATPDVVMGLSHYMHGEVCRVSPAATAFAHRQAHAVYLRAAFSWTDPAESDQRIAWGKRWLQQLRPSTNERLYANYQTYETEAGSASLWDLNYARLLSIKRQYDPRNFFRRNANIA